jgi:hypothetical protein
MSEKNILRIYILEDMEIKSLLDYTGYEICLLFNEIVEITGRIYNIDLLIGKEYGLIECDLDIANNLIDKIIQIYPHPTARNSWPNPVFVQFISHF